MGKQTSFALQQKNNCELHVGNFLMYNIFNVPHIHYYFKVISNIAMKKYAQK